MVFHSCSNPSVLEQNVFFTDAEAQMSQRFVDYWTTFVKTGNPNTASQPAWPVWDPSTRNALLIQTPIPVVTNASIAPCGLWDALGYGY